MNEKMKPGVVAIPATREAKIIAVLVIVSILLGIAPAILIFNLPILVFGIPLLILWCVLLSLFVMFVIRLADKWGVH